MSNPTTEEGSQAQPSITPVITPAAPAETKIAPVTSVTSAPVVPAAAPSEKKEEEMTPADALFELDKRGFKSMDIALRMIKRYDDSVKEARVEAEKQDERIEEMKKMEVRFLAREAEIKKAADHLLDLRADQDARLTQMNERIELLTKLES